MALPVRDPFDQRPNAEEVLVQLYPLQWKLR